jgi:hypothetical protein
VVEDWIYYRNNDDGWKIYKLRTYGSDRTKVNDDSTAGINIVDDWIYYINVYDESNRSTIGVVDDFKIYKVRTDGSGRTKISDDPTVSFNVVGNWIFYSTTSSANGGSDLYRILTDGGDRQVVN